MGGDHTIALPILRALNKTYGPISVIHFDAHLDTWRGGIGHGTFLSVASKEGLISNNSIHAGIRCKIAVCAPIIDTYELQADMTFRDGRTLKMIMLLDSISSLVMT